jgi:DNA-binding NtrC family response regulator
LLLYHNQTEINQPVNFQLRTSCSTCMSRPRLFLLDYDAALNSILVRFFSLEGIEVTVCKSADDLRRRLAEEPQRIVIADWCNACVTDELTAVQREEIEEIGRTSAGLVLTSGHSWATYKPPRFTSGVVVIAKPYDLDRLLDAVRSIAQPQARPDEVSVSVSAQQ